ncbi:uncharacterized protein TNCV_4444111 [Trichonephila clavipes]|nr:uncharacterized protein TNCV_4444111 [Trichonephila clavipes]
MLFFAIQKLFVIDPFTCRNCGGGDRGRVAIYRPFGEVSLSLNRTVTCMVLKANDRRTSCPCHDEFRGPRSDYVRQVALATTTTTTKHVYNVSHREAGWSNRRIGRHLGRSDMVVARCWQQWITEGRVYRRRGSGRPRNTNDREDRAIRRVATSAPTTSLASIQRHLPPSRHPVPSR